MNIVVDTSAIYAMLDKTDDNHQNAIEAWLKLLNEAELIVASSYVVTEAIALLHARGGTSVVRAFVEEILPVVEIDWVDPATHNAALSAMLMVEGRNGPSLTDCANMETMRRLRIHTIFAYDKHYAREGVTVTG